MTKPKLSELEGVVLGIVFREQHCTAYGVRQVLKDTPSSRWRASAGSIYPLLARLEEQGFVKTTADANDGRERKVLTVTKEGRQALARWIKTGSEPEVIAEVSDPLRSRIFFLDALPKNQQIKFVKDTIRGLEEFVRIARAHDEAITQSKNSFSSLGSKCAIMDSENRLASMKMILAYIE